MNYKMKSLFERKKKSLLMITSYLMLTFKYKVQIFLFNQPVRINLMEKQMIWCSEQNNSSNWSLPPGEGGGGWFYPHTLMFEKKIVILKI